MDSDSAALVDLYLHPRPATGRSWLRTNFVSTLDGSVQGPDGRSGSINTPSDQHVFALQRAHADAILVGAQTVRAEGYRAVDLAPWQVTLRQELGLAPEPLLVVITRSLALDPQIATAGDHLGGPVMIITTTQHDVAALDPYQQVGITVVQLGEQEVDLGAALDHLAQQGFQRILCEGGAHLHHALLAAGLVDEMCLTLAPTAVGGPGLRATAGPLLATPETFTLHHVLYDEHDNALFTRYLADPSLKRRF